MNFVFIAKYIPPVRYVFVLMGFLGFNMIYALRVNLSVALVSMVTSHSNANTQDSHTNGKPCEMPITTSNNSANFAPKVSKLWL